MNKDQKNDWRRIISRTAREDREKFTIELISIYLEKKIARFIRLFYKMGFFLDVSPKNVYYAAFTISVTLVTSVVLSVILKASYTHAITVVCIYALAISPVLVFKPYRRIRPVY
jgi:hypothetical protein